MSKSDGNTITPQQLFSGESEHTSKGYDPMTVRFFFLQAHYSSTLDLSDAALQAAEKGFKKLINALPIAEKLETNTDDTGFDSDLSFQIIEKCEQCYREMSDDFNTAKTLAVLFELAGKLNELENGQIHLRQLSNESIEKLKSTYASFVQDVLGLQPEEKGSDKTGDVIEILLNLRQEARANKNWTLSDQIRDQLADAGIEIKDGKEGTTYSF